jgi:calcineurin-like phosphoesterase family protein
MSTVWFTADLHLGHGNIIKYCARPFLTDEERDRAARDPRGHWRVSDHTLRRHDDALLDAINAMVARDDTLWMLGDFCRGRFDDARAYRDRIHCRNVHLVWGNHDHPSIRSLFGDAIQQGMVCVEGQEIWLNHYPMRSWNKSFHGSWHVYGHVHGRLRAEDAAHPWTLTADVGVDAWEYQPVSFTALQAYMAPRIEQFHQRKARFAQGDGPADL